jgi:hypothetical protein
MLGGTTYEESRTVALLNQQLAGQTRIIIGGSYVHNSKSFLDMLSNAAEHSGAWVGGGGGAEADAVFPSDDTDVFPPEAPSEAGGPYTDGG